MSAMLAPTATEIGSMAAIVVWFMAFSGVSDRTADWINTIGVLAFSVVVGWGAYRELRQGATAIWMPILWYRTAMVVYFGVGSLVPIYANADTREMLLSFYSFFSSEVIKLNLLVAIFHLVFVIVAKIVIEIFAYRRSRMARDAVGNSLGMQPSNFNLISLATACLIVGTVVNYLVVLPQILGWYEFSLISTLSNFASLAWIGYFMAVYWGMEHKKYGVVAIVIAIAAGECVIGLLNMSKAVILMPVVMVGIGFIYQRASFRRIVFFSIALSVSLLVLSPMIGSVRDQANSDYAGRFTPSDTFDMYSRYITQGVRDDRYADVQSGWARLSFVNAGTFVISQYDHGLPGNSFRYLPIVLIPRIIYPDKPIITDVARELSYAANGNYYSSSTAGLPAEAYWNYGWPGAILVAIFLSSALSLWSVYAFAVIDRGAWHLFFVVLLGARTAMRIDGAFVSDVVGPIGVAILAHFALALLNRFLPNRVTHMIRDDAPARA